MPVKSSCTAPVIGLNPVTVAPPPVLFPPVTAPNPANSVAVGEPELPDPDKSLGLTDPRYVLAVLVPVPPGLSSKLVAPPTKRFGL
jgi:hypothetical protein